MPGQRLERFAIAHAPGLERFTREVIQQAIEAVLAQLRRPEWLLAELGFQVILEEGIQLLVHLLPGAGNGPDAKNQGGGEP